LLAINNIQLIKEDRVSHKIKIPWAKPEIGKEELNAVIETFNSNWLTTGKKVKSLEQYLSKFLDIEHAIAVSNGTDAIDVALKTIGVGQGHEVIVPASSYIATASAVSYQNAMPVFVDIDAKTMNIQPERIIEAISENTRAIIFIDYGGYPAEGDKVRAIAKEYNIPVILDGAHSIGTLFKGETTISQNEISTMSFHMAKTFTTVEGGMVFTKNDNWAEEIRIRINQGESGLEKYDHVLLGTNARMTDIAASIGLEQCKKIDQILLSRKNIAQQYDQFFKNSENIFYLIDTTDSTNSYFLYPIHIDNRDMIAKELLIDYGIDTRVSWPKAIYDQSLYKLGDNPFKKFDCPNAEISTKKVLNLPMFPSMTNDQVSYVAKTLIKLTNSKL
jgi:perosamine synthetase